MLAISLPLSSIHSFIQVNYASNPSFFYCTHVALPSHGAIAIWTSMYSGPFSSAPARSNLLKNSWRLVETKIQICYIYIYIYIYNLQYETYECSLHWSPALHILMFRTCRQRVIIARQLLLVMPRPQNSRLSRLTRGAAGTADCAYSDWPTHEAKTEPKLQVIQFYHS
jgi:hypothetical protein